MTSPGDYGRTGRGPGEYVSIASIEYDPFNDEIVVLDSWNKVLRFSPDGTLIDETRNNTISTLAYIIPGFIDGNVMYCSLPQDDGGTTLLRITL